MKIKFLPSYCALFLFLFTTSIVFSQTQSGAPAVPEPLNCKYTFSTSLDNCDEEFSHSVDQADLDSYEPVVFNVYFWELRRDDGSLDSEAEPMVFENESLDVIAALNIFYNPYNVFFKYNGRNTIDNTDLYDIDGTNGSGLNYINNYPIPADVIEPNSINIYVSANIDYGNASVFKPKVEISREKFKGQEYDTLHEVGHVLGLIHTHEYYTGTITGEDCEHVTRDPNNGFYNADEAGDRVIDTAASSPLYQPDSGFDEVDPEDCTYIGDGTDCHGEEFVISPDDVKNIMGYTRYTCKDRITIGQAIRMRESIEIDCKDELTPTIRTDGVASLYEPYKGIYPYPNNTYTAYQPPRFQPGFDYKFLNCYPNGGYPQPSDYTDTSFSYIEGGMWWYGFNKNILVPQYPTIIHKDGYAIRIEQLDQQPRKCYNTGQGPVIGGTVIKFNDNVLNTNVTITPQDSMSINNEELINELNPGLYNIIKNYENGNTQETVILKENN